MASGLKTPLQHVLFAMSGWQGRIGASCRRKLMRRLGQQSVRDFMAVLAKLRPGDICLDCGANLGVFTEMLANSGAEVHAFEPDPHCFALLQDRFKNQPNVHLHNAAIAAKAGRLPLRRSATFHTAPDKFSQMSSIAINSADYDGGDVIEVDVVAFRDVINQFDRPVALVKMDIEGAEFDILDDVLAAPETLRVKAMFVETHERHAPERVAQIKAIRMANWRGDYPFLLDTFWP